MNRRSTVVIPGRDSIYVQDVFKNKNVGLFYFGQRRHSVPWVALTTTITRLHEVKTRLLFPTRQKGYSKKSGLGFAQMKKKTKALSVTEVNVATFGTVRILK